MDKKSYIGETFKPSNSHNRGLINDHVGVYSCSIGKYEICVRKEFEACGEPKKFDDEDFSTRGWDKIEIIVTDVSKDIALRRGEEVAKSRNLVLCVEESNLECKIKWHPPGWAPIMEEDYTKYIPVNK